MGINHLYTYLDPRPHTSVQDVVLFITKPRFCSNCGLELPDPSQSISNT